ncbi:hypothetical protein ACNVED_03810 [Legionella sp. D16C41]|uniref:hypothetical protein n=1 Tax=Legionella sp. D16C41 TaxID=3402688 RepID=UPI003AF59C84
MSDTIPQKMVKWLFHDTDSLSFRFGGWIKLLWAMIFKASSSFTVQFFNALKEKIAATFGDKTLSAAKKEIICYNALSYLAFAHPQEGSQLDINGITYTIHKIKLTSGWFSSPYYAYGLTSKASSILIFPGTTVPSDRGFIAGILGDTMPGGAVGTFLYSRGKKQIQSWINSEYQRTGRPVICTGQSLGGAMSMHCHVHQPTKVDFYVFNPPTLTSREARIYERNKSISSDKSERTLKVITHHSDPVFRMGSYYLPPGTKIFRHGSKNENSLTAHAKAPNFKNHTPEIPDTFVDYERQQLKTRIWKLQKVCLFMGALLCQMICLLPRFIIHTAYHIKQFHHMIKRIIKNLSEHIIHQQLPPKMSIRGLSKASEYIESSRLILSLIGPNAASFNNYKSNTRALGTWDKLEYPTCINYKKEDSPPIFVKKNNVSRHLNAQDEKASFLNNCSFTTSVL